MPGVAERIEWVRKLGLGHVIDREDIDRQATTSVQDLLRTVPGVRVTTRPSGGRAVSRVYISRGVPCEPAVYLDGVRSLSGQDILDAFAPGDIEAIEVYRSAAESPGEYPDPSNCGVVLVWTRRQLDGGKKLTLGRILGAVGAIVVTLILMR